MICKSLLALGVVATFASAAESCKERFTALSGEFTSPNFPEQYPTKKRCKYIFKTGYPIRITCPVFRLQNAKNGECKKDYLSITDAGTKTKYCGSVGPSGYVSQGKNIKIVFRSNRRGVRKGFSCIYESIVDTDTPALLDTAINLHSEGTCYTNERSTCGCSATNEDSEYYSSISGDTRIVVTTGIPDHVYETGQQVANPNKACPHEVYMGVPVNPVKGSTYTEYGMGPVGIAISGGFFYNHLSSPFGDVALTSEGESFDSCNGHSDPFCRYHYHLIPKCIASEGSCSHVGYMRDGFPVYTYCLRESDSDYLKSCYQANGSGDGSHQTHYTFNQTALDNGDCDLDKANGYTFSDERGYAYIFSEDYPFIMAGYYGTSLSSICYLTDG